MATYRALTTYFASSDQEGMQGPDMGNMTFTGISLMEIADLPFIYSQDYPTSLKDLTNNFHGIGVE